MYNNTLFKQVKQTDLYYIVRFRQKRPLRTQLNDRF